MTAEDESTNQVVRPICPVCEREEPTTRVSAIYRRQTCGTLATELAHSIAPPQEPHATDWTYSPGGDVQIVLLIAVLICGGLPIVVALLWRGPNFGVALLGSLALLAGVLWLIHRFNSGSRRYRRSDAGRRAFAKYERATAKWERAYYCQKDDVVFIPGQPGSCAPPNFQCWLTEH